MAEDKKGLIGRLTDVVRPSSTAARIEAEEQSIEKVERELDGLRTIQDRLLLEDAADNALRGAEKIDAVERRLKIHRNRMRALQHQLRHERVDELEHAKQRHIASTQKLTAERAAEASRIDRALREVRSAILAYEQKNEAIRLAWRRDLYGPYWTAPSSKLIYHFAGAFGTITQVSTPCLELLGREGELGSIAVLDANHAASLIEDMKNETLPPLPDDDDEGGLAA